MNVDAAFAWRTYWLSAAGTVELQKTNATNPYAFRAEQAWPERARSQNHQVRHGKSEVAAVATQLTRIALRAAAHQSHGYGKILKICEILDRARREIESSEKSER